MDVIIGAGATGLTYASFTNNDYLIFEAENQIGGYCKTIKQDGFVWDYSGHFFHFRYPEFEKYICEYIASQNILKCLKHTQIFYKGCYINFPFQKNIHQLPKEEFIDCLYDLFNNNFKDYRSFKEMLYCKFGKSIAEKFLIPYNEKLYACNLDKLDSNAMGRFFPFANKEDIIRNFRKTISDNSYNDTFTYPKGGAIEYIDSLKERVDIDKISLNETVLQVDSMNKIIKTNRRALPYDNLISTIPLPNLLDITHIMYNKQLYAWNKVLVFNLGFDLKGDDIKNNWVYFPDNEYVFYRVGYYDNIFNGDRMSLYVELGFDKDIDVNVDKYFQIVMKDLQKAKIVTTQHLISINHIIMNPAYVHITNESNKDAELQKKYLAEHNVYTIGRYGGWTYCSIEDGMVEARNLAFRLSV